MKRILLILSLILVLSIAGFAQSQIIRAYPLLSSQATQYVYAASLAGDSSLNYQGGNQYIPLIAGDLESVYQKFQLYPDSITVYYYAQDSVNAKIYFKTQTFGETATRDSVTVVTNAPASATVLYGSITIPSAKWKFKTSCGISVVQSSTGIGYNSTNQFHAELILWYKAP